MKFYVVLAWSMLCLCSTVQAHFSPGFGGATTSSHSVFGAAVAIDGYFHLTDSVVLSDSLTCYLPDSFNLDSFSFIDSAAVYESGDSVAFTVYLSFEHSVLPYFYQSISIGATAHKGTESEEMACKAYLFFSPWNVLEIWSLEDFYNCGRRWHHPDEYSSPPTRTSIAQNVVPASTYHDTGNYTEEWELDYQSVEIPGLPFGVKMAALHPDTIDSLALYYGDDSIWSDPYDSTTFTVLPGYTGTVQGRLMANITNDFGVQVSIPLSGVMVQLKERDAFYDELFGETHTDENGNFSIFYAHEQAWENGAIELFLCFKSKNKQYNFVVSNNSVKDISVVTTADDHREDIGSTPEVAGTITVPTITLQGPAFWMCHWVENAYRFADEEGVGVYTEKLKILLNSQLITSNFAPGILFGSENFVFKPGLPADYCPTIRMEARQLFDENTIYHEWGHYYLWALQNRNYIDVYNYEGLFHSWDEEHHSRLAWSEGFANAMQMILDAHYWEQDNEYGYEGLFRINGSYRADRVERFEQRFNFSTGSAAQINSGFNSEYYFACALYDLWDGEGKGLPDPSNGGTIPSTSNHPWNDQFTSSDYKNWSEIDNVSLEFADLIQPILDHAGPTGKLHNMYEYFDYLINDVYNDCKTRQAISHCLYENDILLDIDEKTNYGLNTGMSSDNISFIALINDKGWNLTAGLVDGFLDNWNDMVNGTWRSFLEAEEVDWPLMDDITIYKRNYFERIEGEGFNWNENGGVMTDNYRLGYRFPAPAAPSFFHINEAGTADFSASTCGEVLIEVDHSTFVIGNSNGASTTFTLNADALMRLDEYALLKIYDNARLVIEEGAELALTHDCEIELLGDNAVIEIKGHLNLHVASSLSFTGSGKVIFNSSQPNCITFGSGSKIDFDGSGPTDVVMEVHQNDLYVLPGDNAGSNNSINISNGKVLLADNTRLMLSCEVDFDNVHFDRLNATDLPKGLYLYGQPNAAIDNCQFSHCIYGIYSAQFLGNKLELYNTTFSDCEYGLFSWRHSAETYGCTFTDCTYGWYARGASLPGYMESTTISGCHEGISFTGNTTLQLSSSTIHHNEHNGVYFSGRTFGAWCGHIENNYQGVVGICDEMILSNKFKPYTGNMTIKDNQYGLAFNGVYLRLNWGNNSLVSTHPLSSTNLNIAAIHESWYSAGRGMTNHQVLASDNKWDHNSLFNFPDYQSINSVFTHYGNHRIDRQDPLGGYVPSTVKSYSTITSVPACPSVYDPTDFNGFILVEDEFHNSEHGTPLLDFVALEGHSNHEFQGNSLTTAVEASAQDMYDYGIANNYTIATERFADIIRVTDNSNWEYPNDAYVGYLLDYAYLRMMEAFEYACLYEGAIDAGNTALLNEVIDVQQSLIAVALDETNPDMDVYHARFKYNLDLATTQWLAENHTAATGTLTAMQMWTTGHELDVVNNTQCRINYENDVLQGTIALQDVGGASIYPCIESLVLPKIVEDEVTRLPHEVSSTDIQLNVYPNPSSGDVMLSFTGLHPQQCDVIVYDHAGKTVWSRANLKPDPTGQFVLPSSSFTNGLYYVQIQHEGLTGSGTFSIQR